MQAESFSTKVEKNVPCPQCGKFYASAERVRIHERRCHTSKTCTLCGTVGLGCNCKKIEKTQKRNKNFQCDNCGRSFSQGYHLRRHQMIHTGERPFVCDICSRAFYRKDKLSRHKRVHLNPSSKGARSNVLNSSVSSNGTSSVTIAAQSVISNSIPSISGGLQIFPVHLGAHITHQAMFKDTAIGQKTNQTNQGSDDLKS